MSAILTFWLIAQNYYNCGICQRTQWDEIQQMRKVYLTKCFMYIDWLLYFRSNEGGTLHEPCRNLSFLNLSKKPLNTFFWWMLIFLIPWWYLQVRSPTGVHGRAASGALHEAMNSPDTSGSTPEQSHSNAVTATGERTGPPVNVHESWHVTWRDVQQVWLSTLQAAKEEVFLSNKVLWIIVWFHASSKGFPEY